MPDVFHPLLRQIPLIAGGTALCALTSGLIKAEANETARGRAEARLERAGFELVGAPRRKGDFLIVTATRESISWRLVVDGRSGEIVGQKPIGQAPAAAD